jgi:hypothetical protein
VGSRANLLYIQSSSFGALNELLSFGFFFRIFRGSFVFDARGHFPKVFLLN